MSTHARKLISVLFLVINEEDAPRLGRTSAIIQKQNQTYIVNVRVPHVSCYDLRRGTLELKEC